MFPPPIRTLSVSPKTELIIHPTTQLLHRFITPLLPPPTQYPLNLTLTQLLLLLTTTITQNKKYQIPHNSFSLATYSLLLSFFLHFPQTLAHQKRRKEGRKINKQRIVIHQLNCRNMVDSPLLGQLMTFHFQLFSGKG